MSLRLVLLFLFIPLFVSPEILVDTTYTEVKHFNQSDWDNITKNHEYPKPGKMPGENGNTFSAPHWLKYFIYAAIIALLVFLIYTLILHLSSPSNKRVGDKTVVEVIEDDIDYDFRDLEENLSSAIDQADFRKAVRFYYLIALRELSSARLIIASRDKTNYEYLRELNSHPVTSLFRDITRTFEKTWYGEIKPVSNEYTVYEDKLKKLLSEIKINKKDIAI